MFENIWNLIKTHLVPLLTASNIALLAGFALALIPKIKRVFNANAEVTTTLAQKLNDVKEIAGELRAIKNEIVAAKETSAENANKHREVKELLSLADEKINAVLDIQKTAYGAQKISEVKDTISNIYTNARFDTSAQRKKMAQGAREAVEKVTKLATEVTEQLVEIEHTAEPKESGHISTITL